MGRLIFFIILCIFSGIGDFSDSRNRKYGFCVYKIFSTMILYWNIFYLYIFTVKFLFIYLHRIK